MRTQTKIAALFFLLSLFIIAVLSSSVYFFIIRYSFADFYKRLEIRGVITARSVLDHEEAGAAVLREVRRLHLKKLPEEREYFYEITPGKTFETEAHALDVPVSFFTDLVRDGEATHQNDETFFAGIRYESTKGTYAVIVSADNYYNSQHFASLRNIFFISIFGVSLLTLIISVFFSRRVFTPVKEITHRVKEISSQSLHLRLTPRKGNDEVTELETTFNTMLDRLETSFETQNNFISSASHELNTPLTTIIGEAEVALYKERSKEEYVKSLNVILSKAERLQEITRSLLFLAQTGFRGKTLTYDTIRTDQLLWDVKETQEKINPKYRIQINLDLMPENPERLKIAGNEQLLHMAISNIVSNACKYSDNRHVILSIGTSEHEVVIIVKDNGIGIPEEELKYIYDPFFRASNTRNYEGYGIGLPLTRNIMRLHQGTIKVSSRVGEGTTVQLTFPAII
jgi:signal transduction histidine kinase